MALLEAAHLKLKNPIYSLNQGVLEVYKWQTCYIQENIVLGVFFISQILAKEM